MLRKQMQLKKAIGFGHGCETRSVRWGVNCKWLRKEWVEEVKSEGAIIFSFRKGGEE
jgi:hypothetical protein